MAFAAENLVIRTSGLTKKFDEETAVDHINLKIPGGKIFGFIGPSGCGKTTTVRLLTGVYAPTEGSARVFDRDPTKFRRQDQERIGYMPQLFVLYPDLTVWENMSFTASLYGVPWRQRRDRLQQLLDLVELGNDKDKVARELSGGMQRRLTLAAALIHDPELLFLDEPTTGIDPVLRHKFWEHFRTLQKSNRTLFITTQYVAEAAYCDYVGVMAEGRLLVIDTPKGLRRRASGGDVVDLHLKHPLRENHIAQIQSLPFVCKEVVFLDKLSLQLVVEEASVAIPRLVRWFEERDLAVTSIHEYFPPFDDVFVELVARETAEVA